VEFQALDDPAVSEYLKRRAKDLNMGTSKVDYIKYRMERAWKTLEDAKSPDPA
jgi:hypothetical protein